MRLVDFLIAVLETHAQALQRLAAFFGEEHLLELLEAAGEDEKDPGPRDVHPGWFNPAKPGTSDSTAYAELEGAVRELRLPAVLEFHLWAYPFYRIFVESPLELNATFRTTDASASLVEEAVRDAEKWARKLPMDPSVSAAAERAAQVPWVRFRSNVLKKAGTRPLGPVA